MELSIIAKPKMILLLKKNIVLGFLNPNPSSLVANMTSKTKNYITSLSFIKKLKKISNLHTRLILNKQDFTKIMSCLIILSKCQDLGLYLGSVEVYSGQHVVDFQPLGLKSDRNEGGGILGNWNLKILIFTFLQHKHISYKYTDHISINS